MKSRVGSALLVVLGMVAFMVVSAVTFSVFMRTSRLPSSYLRRNVTSRYLLKSALMNAIERIDGVGRTPLDVGQDGSPRSGLSGVGDAPYPGVGLNANAGNFWNHRVFMPFGELEAPRLMEDETEKTVTTLTLEGLAYLPPAIVNEARVFSRNTRTARWCNLAYESGRYAFCAIDVSDCFDINKLRATARTSASGQRIGFSAAFADAIDAKGSWSDFFDTEMSKFNSLAAAAAGGNPAGFFSLADYNLQVGKNNPLAPFCRHVGQAGSYDFLSEDDEATPGCLFVTDTWFPPTNTFTAVTKVDLESEQDQPFVEFNEEWNASEILDRADESDFGQSLRNFLGEAATVCLYDYLDGDNLPSSFALPTVETAPMVCALAVRNPDGGEKGAFDPQVKENKDDVRTAEYDSGLKDKDGKSLGIKNKVVATPYVLDWNLDELLVQGLVTYPFKRLSDKNKAGANYPTSFTLEGLARFFIGPSDMNCHLVENSPIVPKTEEDWKNPEKTGMVNGMVGASLEIRQSDLSFKKDLPSQEDAVKLFSGKVAFPSVPQKPVLFWKVEHTKYDKSKKATTTTWYSLDGVLEQEAPPVFYDQRGEPLLKDGVPNEACSLSLVAKFKDKNRKVKMFDKSTKFSAGVKDEEIASKAADDKTDIDTTAFSPQVALWLVLKNNGGAKNGRAVDVVPAWGNDDVLWGERHRHRDNAIAEVVNFQTYEEQSPHPPIIRFCNTKDSGFAYGQSALAENQAKDRPEKELQHTVLFAVDPRYNYSPQAWYDPKVAFADLEPKSWLDAIDPVLGAGGRDPDIFMFTADQEYLQSMGELQFLPVVRALEQESGSHRRQTAFTKLRLDYQFDAASPSAVIADFAPGMWRTYSAVRHHGMENGKEDDVYSLDDPALQVTAGSGDFRVNPFTADKRIFMAALANTPYDYFVASTNNARNTLKKCNFAKNIPEVAAGLTHAFNSKTKLDGEVLLTDYCEDPKKKKKSANGAEADISELEELAEEMQFAFRNLMVGKTSRVNQGWVDWEDIYDNLEWFDGKKGDEQDTLFGVELEHPLHAVDRKFLYSFWRECFQNRQHLFLVFLRAEPLTVGGGGRASMANAQLGARGVALVWRDPKPPCVKNKTRVVPNGADYHAGSEEYGKQPPHRTRVLFYHQFD